MSNEPTQQTEEWEGQRAMGDRLVSQALGDTPVEYIPIDDRCVIFPVVPDEQRPVDLTVVQMGGQDLPEMGVLVAVGYLFNAKAVDLMNEAASPAQQEIIARTMFFELGDVVCVNKFSGMDIPGTNLVQLSRHDVLGKLRNFPVRLRLSQERWDTVQADRAAAEAGESMLATPSRKIVTGVR